MMSLSKVGMVSTNLLCGSCQWARRLERAVWELGANGETYRWGYKMEGFGGRRSCHTRTAFPDSEYFPCFGPRAHLDGAMPGSSKDLNSIAQEKISGALNSEPCCRCKGDHQTKQCPMNPLKGLGGRVWREIKRGGKEAADKYLLNHADHVGDAGTTGDEAVPSSSATLAEDQTTADQPCASAETSDQIDSQTPVEDSLADQMTATNLDSPAIEIVEVPLGDAADVELTVPFNAEASVQAATYVRRELYNPDESKILQLLVTIKVESDYPLRNAFHDKTGRVSTNHFEVTIDPKAQFYEYQIVGIPEAERRAGQKRYMDTIFDRVPFLKSNQDFFATDSINKIIAWKPLAQLALGAQTDLIKIKDGDRISELQLRYNGPVEFQGFKDYMNSKLKNPGQCNVETIKNALNIILAKCFNNSAEIFHLNSHKFFISKAFKDLKAGNDKVCPLRAIRGFSYTVKSGMGKILLNVAPTTSAFWNPLLVSEVLLHGMAAFGHDYHALIGLQVHINYDRGRTPEAKAWSQANQFSHIKKIRGFGQALNEQLFTDEIRDCQGNATGTTTYTVSDYLEQSKCNAELCHRHC